MVNGKVPAGVWDAVASQVSLPMAMRDYQKLKPKVLVRHFTATEPQGNLDLVGDDNGLFADAAHGAWRFYQTLQISSPPALLRRQSASFIRPLEVETMPMPK